MSNLHGGGARCGKVIGGPTEAESMATVYPEACNLCAAVTYTRSPTRSRNCCLERAGGGVAEVACESKNWRWHTCPL